MSSGPEWRDVPGYEGYYQVSNDGRVRSVDRVVPCLGDGRPRFSTLRKGVELKPHKDKYGYMIVNLSKDGTRKKHKVHRLVMLAFAGECPDGLQVNHKDENKANNRVGNLEYVTCKENINYGARTEKAISKRRKPVFQIDNGDIVARYPSIAEAQRQTGCWDIEISRCCRGIIKSSGGYQWAYA